MNIDYIVIVNPNQDNSQSLGMKRKYEMVNAEYEFVFLLYIL